jgi:hypothetical protein
MSARPTGCSVLAATLCATLAFTDALAPLLVLTALLVAGGLPVLVALAALVARYRRRAPASPAWGT